MKVLLVEDNPGFSRLMELTLAGSEGGTFDVARVGSLAEAKEHLRVNRVDVVLCDLGLPDSWGLDTLTSLLPHVGGAAMVVMTSLGDEETGAQAIKDGAHDFLIKDEITPPLLLRSLRYAVERRNHQENLERQATHDALTGLPNRLFLEGHFKRALKYARKSGTSLALAYLDLDRFKNINDSLGHPVGDQLLIQVAGRLRNTIRSRDLVVRMGGDEFAFLLTEADETTTIRVLERIQAAFQVEYRHQGNRLNVGCSIGVALHPRDGEDFTELFRQADQAMYRAKQRGGGFAFYDAAADRILQERQWLESELRIALERGRLQVYYQPMFDLGSGALVRAEALVRWPHRERGMVSTGVLIQVAEESGLIARLDRWVLQTAMREASAGGFAVSVNLSPVTLSDPDLPHFVTSRLKRAGLPAEHLCLEITEQMLARPEEVLPALQTFDALGVQVAVDDFGTGYSSLAYLTRYPLDILKLDASFVQTIEDDPRSKIVARAVIDLARNLGLRTVAEGIETKVQLAWLEQQGCTMGQGFLLAKPQPLEAMARFVRDRVQR